MPEYYQIGPARQVRVNRVYPCRIQNRLDKTNPIHQVKPGTDKSVPTIFVIIVGTVLTVPAQKPLK